MAVWWKNHDKKSYPSPKLAAKRAATAEKKRAREDSRIKPCIQCGRVFQGKSKNLKLCSRGCRNAHQSQVLRGKRYQLKLHQKCCVVCTSAFTSAKSTTARCRGCQRAVTRAATGRSRQSHTARARSRGVAAERVNRIAVFDDYGWRCAICGIDTPRAFLRDYKHPQAPTLDHIVPIAKGGTHTRANTQCLCRSCNSRKADKPQPQTLDEILVIAPTFLSRVMKLVALKIIEQPYLFQ